MVHLIRLNKFFCHIFIFFLLASTTAYAQSVQEAYELMSRGKYKEAQSSLKNLGPEEKSTAGYFYCKAQLYASNNYRAKDYGLAYGNILEAKRLFSNGRAFSIFL